MSRRLLFNKLYLLPLLMMALSFASCSDDDDDFGGENSANSHIGKWFLDWSSPEKTIWTEMDFDVNGNYTCYQIISSLKEGLSLKHTGTTSYTRQGNTLVCQEDYSNVGTGIQTVKYDITYTDKYTLTLCYAQGGSDESYSRIVNEYYIKAGESIPFGFQDSEFSDAGYSTTDERIARVDDSGIITAIKHGDTYITARASSGRAVTIKVHVVDFEQPYTEYGEDLTLTKKQVIAKYGNNYSELDSINSIVYFVGDLNTEKLSFKFTKHDKVEQIIALQWDGSYVAEMAEYFKKKYKIVQQENGFYGFYNSDDKCQYFITTDTEHKMNGYQRILPDFEQYDDLIVNGSADELVGEFGYVLTSQSSEYGLFPVTYGNMYDSILFKYDKVTRKTLWIKCFLKDKFSVEKATEMVTEFYPYYFDGLGYFSSKYIDTIFPLVSVNVEKDEDSGLAVITYVKYKQ